MRIRNWDKFQHYKPKNAKGHRKMAWIKVYPDLLQDDQFIFLSDTEKALLLELWCLASERSGYLKDINQIAFRTRRDPDSLNAIIEKLHHFIDMDAEDTEDIVTQVDTPKKERW